MAVGLISKKYLIDCANAIRVMLGTESTYTPAQMATAIANITGSLSGEITKSSNTDVGLITDSLLEDICDALRTKLDDQTLTFTPSQIADAIISIHSSALDIVSFSSGTDQQIAAMLEAAHNGDIDLQTDGGWAVGDTRSIDVAQFYVRSDTICPAQSVDIVISQFGDYNNCGCVMQFDFKNALSKEFSINSTSTNSGGWGSTTAYSYIMPNLVNALPTWLKDSLITFSCLSTNGNNSSTLHTDTNNKLALRSEIELTGTVSSSCAAEGAQVDYYKTASNRKKGHNYWLRSPQKYQTQKFCYYYEWYESISGEIATSASLCFAPFGCL